MSLNKVQIIGNLTRDPEMRQIPGGQVVTSFTIATNFSWTDQTGNKQDKAEFHNVVAWRKLGEICGQYLKKGSKTYIEGRLQTRSWEAEDGSKRYRTEIVADNMIMLDRKGEAVGNFESQDKGVAVFESQDKSAVIAETSAPVQEEHAGLGKKEEEGEQSQKEESKKVADKTADAAEALEDEEVTIDDLPF